MTHRWIIVFGVDRATGERDARGIIDAAAGCWPQLAEEKAKLHERGLAEERRTPPAPIGHEFQKPMVEELPRATPHSARERINASKGDMSKNRGDDS